MRGAMRQIYVTIAILSFLAYAAPGAVGAPAKRPVPTKSALDHERGKPAEKQGRRTKHANKKAKNGRDRYGSGHGSRRSRKAPVLKAKAAKPARVIGHGKRNTPQEPPDEAVEPPVAATWTEMVRAAARFRSGQMTRLIPDLERLQRAKDPQLAAAAAHVHARLLAHRGEGTAAGKLLAKAKAVAEVAPAARRWAEIEALRAQGKDKAAFDKLGAFRRDFGDFRWAAADLLYSRLAEQVAPSVQAAEIALQLYEKSAQHLPRDELLARAARVLHKADPGKSAQLWKKLLVDHPESDFAAQAELQVKLTTDDEQFDRMATLFARRAYERCRSAGVQLWVKGHRRAEVGYFLGKIGSERLRDDYAGAAGYLQEAIDPSAPNAQAALSSYALLLGKLGKFDESIAQFDLWLQRYPLATNERRIDLHYDRARTLHMAGRSLQAADDLTRALDLDERGIDAGKYRWFTGFWALLGGKPELAMARLAPLQPNANPLVGAKARYWVAKAQDRLGKREDAVATLVALVDRYPLTYYGGLAENLLQDWGCADKLPKHEDFSKISVQRPDPFAGIKMTDNVQRLRFAVALGEPDVAVEAYRALENGLRMELGTERLRRLKADLADELEQFSDVREEALRQSDDVLKKLPTRDTVAQWRAIYPRAFATHVVASAARWGAPEWMVYAHMLQESRYKPHLISNAPAYGLLELLDRTAVRLANEAHEDYQLWMLLQPSHNVRWGAQYLGALYKKFHHQLPFAIASYNGGPMLMEYHLTVQHRLGRSFDELIDDLGPHESRNYVRMVIGHFLRYLAIYETPARAKELRAQLLPRSWSAEFLKEPDY